MTQIYVQIPLINQNSPFTAPSGPKDAVKGKT
jgi:hypothetical protein